MPTQFQKQAAGRLTLKEKIAQRKQQLQHEIKDHRKTCEKLDVSDIGDPREMAYNF